MRIPIHEWVEWLVYYLRDNYRPIFRSISAVMEDFIFGFEDVLGYVPIAVFIVLLTLLAWRLAGRGVALFAVLGLGLVVGIDLWDETLRTLALVISSSAITLVLAIPIGILASRSNTLESILRPVLDLMQTMPIFVYLLPAVMFFSIGVVPAVIATVVFSMPPAIRLTNLGIRQVPEEMIEAAHAFGSTPMQMLTKVQLPQALPSIMAGVNQSIMLALSMAVISAMIGAGGLGGTVYRAITRHQIGSGFEGGVGVVVAIILDRITQAVGKDARSKEA